MGGDLGEWGKVPPKFEVGHGPCLRPPIFWNIISIHLFILYFYIVILLRVTAHFSKQSRLSGIFAGKIKLFSKQGHSEIWLENF